MQLPGYRFPHVGGAVVQEHTLRTEPAAAEREKIGSRQFVGNDEHSSLSRIRINHDQVPFPACRAEILRTIAFDCLAACRSFEAEHLGGNAYHLRIELDDGDLHARVVAGKLTRSTGTAESDEEDAADARPQNHGDVEELDIFESFIARWPRPQRALNRISEVKRANPCVVVLDQDAVKTTPSSHLHWTIIDNARELLPGDDELEEGHASTKGGAAGVPRRRTDSMTRSPRTARGGRPPALDQPAVSPYPRAVAAIEQTSGLETEWVEIRTGDVRTICRPGVASELSQIYRNHSWVYDAFAGSSGAATLRGRQPVVAGELGGTPVVVKRMFHGGLFGRVSRDAFLTSARARSHVELAEYLRSHGIPTPAVAFVSWRRVRGLVRCEIGFERVEGAIDADRYFFEGKLPADWKERSERIGALVARLHEVGFIHADLNLMNILFCSRGGAYILDLDKTALPRRKPTESERAGNLARLERSVRKQGRKAFSGAADQLVERIRSAYRKSRLV